jgi:hypothetical protein
MPKISEMTDEQLQTECDKFTGLTKAFYEAALTFALGTPIVGYIFNTSPQPLLSIGVTGLIASSLGFSYCRDEFFKIEREQINRADYVPLPNATPTSP